MVTDQNRLKPIIERAIKLVREQGAFKTSLYSPNRTDASALLTQSINRGLILSPEPSPNQPFGEFVAESVTNGTQFIITDQSTLEQNEAWLSDPSNRFVKKGQRLNQITLLDIPAYAKLLLLGNCFGSTTDTPDLSEPDLSAKIKTAEFMINTGLAIGLGQPKIAVLAAVEVVYPQMPVTCDGAVLAKMSDRGQIKNGLVDGPLSLDVAIDLEVAISKGVAGSTVAGQADGFLAPNAETARGIWEASVKFAGAGFASVILGGALPILSLIRSDDQASVSNSVALARLLA